jgi:hypothetical protein
MSEPRKSLDAGTIINLLATVALPVAIELLDIFYRGGEVTPETWIGLRGKIKTDFDVLVPQKGAPA